MSKRIFDTAITITAGELVAGTAVEMQSVLTAIRTGKIHRINHTNGTFVGDYRETDGGEMYFMFRGEEGLFAYPAAAFSDDTIAAYGPFKFDAQSIHENV